MSAGDECQNSVMKILRTLRQNLSTRFLSSWKAVLWLFINPITFKNGNWGLCRKITLVHEFVDSSPKENIHIYYQNMHHLHL